MMSCARRLLLAGWAPLAQPASSPAQAQGRKLSEPADQGDRALPGRRTDRRHGAHHLGPARPGARAKHRGRDRGGGAGGSVGAKVVAAADPDGYTILMTPGGSLTTGPAVHKNIGYDPVKAFAPVGLLITAQLIITVHPYAAGQNRGRARRLCQGQSGQAHRRLSRRRHRAASAHRAVQARNRHQHCSRALSRHRARDRRPARGRDPDGHRSPDHGSCRTSRVARPARSRRHHERSPKMPDVPTMAEVGYPK